jgi:hypothetical protein
MITERGFGVTGRREKWEIYDLGFRDVEHLGDF